MGMAELKKGLAKPYMKTYSKEMLRERLKIMGEPATRSQKVKQIALAASVSLPDLSQNRALAEKKCGSPRLMRSRHGSPRLLQLARPTSFSPR